MAEPQITGQLSIGDVLQIVAGIGYRATSDARFGRSVFSGATGSIGVQFDLGN